MTGSSDLAETPNKLSDNRFMRIELTTGRNMQTLLTMGLLPSVLELIDYESVTCPDYLVNLSICRQEAAARQTAASIITADDVASFNESNLSATNINEALLTELLQVPECSGRPIPNYFNTDGTIRNHLLPDCIKGIEVEVDNLTCTLAEFCLFI